MTALKTYTGEPIRVQGSLKSQVDYNGQSLALPVVVVEGSGPDWLQKLPQYATYNRCPQN